MKNFGDCLASKDEIDIIMKKRVIINMVEKQKLKSQVLKSLNKLGFCSKDKVSNLDEMELFQWIKVKGITISCRFGYDDNQQRSNNFLKVSPYCNFNFLLTNFSFLIILTIKLILGP